MIVYYDESILTYVASIRNYFGLKSSYKTNEHFDNLLRDKNPQKIFLVLIDGMGANLIKRKLPKSAFLRKHMTYETTTVFPTTTTAATISILTGKSPNENAWVGWVQPSKRVDDLVIPFFGQGFYSGIKYDPELMYKDIPYKYVIDELNENGIRATDVYNFKKEDRAHTIRSLTSRLKELSYSDNRFVYAYYDGYDSLMHHHGPNCRLCDDRLDTINKYLDKLSREMNDDTMLVVVADHGQIEVKKQLNIYDTKLNEYMDGDPFIETRAAAFKVKKGKEKAFEQEFKRLYEDEFILLDKKQVLYTHLFGDHKNHPRFEEMIGDFVAIAKKNSVIRFGKDNSSYFKGQHAGMTKDELAVPVITYMK